MIRIRRCLVLACLSAFTVNAFAAADRYERVREQFVRAYAKAHAGSAAPEADSEALRAYPLYPYLQAARIRAALKDAGPDLTAADQRAQTFITYYEREPVGRDLRRTWLESLAERKLWQTYLEHYQADLADPAAQCHSFTARIALNRTEGLADDIRARWLTPKSLPQCERAFAWLREQQQLSPELIESRVRLALKENNARFAREIASQLPSERAPPLLLWAALLEQPQRNIDALIANPGRSVLPEALLAGWTRLARANRDAAISRYSSLVRARKMSEADASPFALALAMPLSWDRRKEALEYFARVKPADLDDNALEWQTRAALWARDWALVARSIAAMSDDARKTARWRYWAARAAERNGETQLARQLYESVLLDDNFYSMMAAARLDQPLSPNLEKLVVDDVQLAQIEQLPELVRARELLLSALRPLALTEWSYGLERLSEEARFQAIHLAARWGWYEQAIATATKQRVFNDYELLYPRPYDREVSAAAKLTNLPRELIYGVLRQESLYRHDAVSSAGAHGLLQLLPETARRTAQSWKLTRPDREDLFVPATNVKLGAAYLRSLMDRFNGQTMVALAGYNAGPGAAARWLPSEAIDADIWVENIPYNETRTYVQRILWHTVVFNWLQNREPQQTKQWLARIEPIARERAALSTAKEPSAQACLRQEGAPATPRRPSCAAHTSAG